jgi:uridine kinase
LKSQPLSRLEMIETLAALILSVECSHPVRVAIDGVDAAGKTMLADELALPIAESGRGVIRATVDGFHQPREIRYQLGINSPEGYYRDSFNYDALLKHLLIPLGPGGDCRYQQQVYDYRIEAPIQDRVYSAPRESVLLFDGIFLLRPELFESWDFSIFIEVDFTVSVSRAVARNLFLHSGPVNVDALMERYQQRYIPGQQIYLRESKPKERANCVLDNNDLAKPILSLI